MKKSYIFYAFVLIFALSVYYFDYYKGEENLKKKDAASVLIPYAKEQINKIELKNNDNEVQLIKDDKGWQLSKPLTDLADENTVSDWLNSLTSEKNTDALGEGETINWATYGLDKPKATVIVYKVSGEKVQIDVATRKNFEGSSFLRKDQGNLVLVATASWQSLVEKTARELRDKRILRMAMTDIETVDFKRIKDVLSLQIKEGLWFIKDKMALQLSQNSARELVNAVSEMRAQEFSLEADPDEKQKLDFGLKSPSLILELKFKDGKIWTADFGQNKDKSWFVWVKDLHKVLKIENTQVDKIVKATTDSLRDREAPFVFKKDDIKKISIQIAHQPAKSMELSKEGEKWKSSLPGEVNEQELSNFLNRLSELRVAEFLDGKVKTKSFEPADQRIILADAEGKAIWSVDIGDSYKKKIEKNENQYFYVKTSAYGDAVAVADSGINSLPLTKIMKTEAAAKNEATPKNEALPQSETAQPISEESKSEQK
jgi:hypothetical protein